MFETSPHAFRVGLSEYSLSRNKIFLPAQSRVRSRETRIALFMLNNI